MASGKEATADAGGDKGVASEKEKEVTGGKMVTLRSKDGKPFEVTEAAARLSVVLGEVIDGSCTKDGIPMLTIDAATLAKVVEYLNKHAEAAAGDPDDDAVAAAGDPDDDAVASIKGVRAAAEEELAKWDAGFVDGLGIRDALFFDLIEAANFLELDGLLDAATKKIADTMRGRTPEEIRSIFNIKDDYTEQEKAEIRREYAWAFPEEEKQP